MQIFLSMFLLGLYQVESAFNGYAYVSGSAHLPAWLRSRCASHISWWWCRWTVAWTAVVRASACCAGTPASRAKDSGSDPASRWPCSSPSNVQTPCRMEQSRLWGPVLYSCICTRISTVLSNTPTVTTKVNLNRSHSVVCLLPVNTHYRIQKLLSLEEVTIATEAAWVLFISIVIGRNIDKT